MKNPFMKWGKLLIKIDYECSFNSSCPRNMEQFGNPFKWWKKMRAQF